MKRYGEVFRLLSQLRCVIGRRKFGEREDLEETWPKRRRVPEQGEAFMRVDARETIREKAVHTICPKRFRHETIRPLYDASLCNLNRMLHTFDTVNCQYRPFSCLSRRFLSNSPTMKASLGSKSRSISILIYPRTLPSWN